MNQNIKVAVVSFLVLVGLVAIGAADSLADVAFGTTPERTDLPAATLTPGPITGPYDFEISVEEAEGWVPMGTDVYGDAKQWEEENSPRKEDFLAAEQLIDAMLRAGDLLPDGNPHIVNI